MNDVKQDPELLKPKQHFAILDGMRGVAALAVVVFHFMEWLFTDITQNFIGHGFLAVDFFFCLSGFVVGYAYDDRIQTMGLKQFFAARLIRLHPLVIFGSVLGLLGFFLDPFAMPSANNLAWILLLFVASLFLIPIPLMEERFFNLFPFNAPAWSLFWEYVANFIYAVVLHKANRRLLTTLTVVAAVVVCFVSYRAGNLLGGWSKDNFFDGAARMGYSFMIGLLIKRSNWIIKNRIGFLRLALLLALAFLMPVTKWNWLAEALVVLFFFPLLVSLGAGSTVSTRWKPICQLCGSLSYPLYMTHYAAIWVFGNYYTSMKPDRATLVLVILSGIFLLLLFAYLVMKFFDIPVRRYLSKGRKTNHR